MTNPGPARLRFFYSERFNVLSMNGFVLVFIALLTSSSALPGESGSRNTGARVDTATVWVHVTGAQNDTGRVVVALYESKYGFPREKDKAAYTASSPIEADSASVRVSGIVEGDYAVFAFHDSDESGTLNTNWVGMPTEGVALSKWTGGRPTFDESTIEVRADTTIDLSFYYR